jgi:hypothetical protein
VSSIFRIIAKSPCRSEERASAPNRLVRHDEDAQAGDGLVWPSTSVSVQAHAVGLRPEQVAAGID